MGLTANNRNMLGCGSGGGDPPGAILEKLIKLPAYAPWFARAKVVSKMACAISARPPLKQVVVGNAMVVGDAGAMVETWVQGAVASAYQAVKALQKQWAGGNGFDEYRAWWQKAFMFNHPDYPKIIQGSSSLISRFSDQDLDDIYKMFEGEVGVPTLMVRTNQERIKAARPDLYAKMTAPSSPAH
jgi:flavin-dependent dehydrogenase